jgi:hypothetical protein
MRDLFPALSRPLAPRENNGEYGPLSDALVFEATSSLLDIKPPQLAAGVRNRKERVSLFPSQVSMLIAGCSI